MNKTRGFFGSTSMMLLAAGAIIFFAFPSLGAVTQDSGFSKWTIMMGLFGGLAIFLYGMEEMTEGLKAVAGEGMGNLLAKLTRNCQAPNRSTF